jgi:hypothetical protein
MSECLIQKTKRQRVKGSGPKRDQMVTFAKLGTVSQELLEKLNSIADKRSGNDLGSDAYNISQHCDVNNVFIDSGYRQILIQENTNLNQPLICHASKQMYFK